MGSRMWHWGPETPVNAACNVVAFLSPVSVLFFFFTIGAKEINPIFALIWFILVILIFKSLYKVIKNIKETDGVNLIVMFIFLIPSILAHVFLAQLI